MARSAKFIWPTPDSAAVAQLQTLAAAGNLILNGNLAVYNSNNVLNPFITLFGINRQITLTSASNLSGVNFTITGTYLGASYSETIAGPNADTVSTVGLYNTVTSISASAGTGGDTVSAGTGANGHTGIYRTNEHSTVDSIGAQVIVTSGLGHITYSFFSSIQSIDQQNSDFSINNGCRTIYNMRGVTTSPNIGSHGMLAIDATGAGAPTYDIPVYGPIPIKTCWFTVTGDLSNPASALFYIMQQGLT
jgi:hypothetical protein